MNDKLEIYLKRKVARTKNNIEHCENYSSDTHTFHGGWSKGYHEGMLSTLEDILDMIEDGYPIEEKMMHEQAYYEAFIKDK